MTKATFDRYLAVKREDIEETVRCETRHMHTEMIMNHWDFAQLSLTTNGYVENDDGEIVGVSAVVYIRIERAAYDYSELEALWCIEGEDIPYEPQRLTLKFDVKGEQYESRNELRQALQEHLEYLREMLDDVNEITDEEALDSYLLDFVDDMRINDDFTKDAIDDYRRNRKKG